MSILSAPDTDGSSSLVLTVEEAARLLGISRALAYELVARRQLPHLRLGRRIVIPRRALEALLGEANQCTRPPKVLK